MWYPVTWLCIGRTTTSECRTTQRTSVSRSSVQVNCQTTMISSRRRRGRIPCASRCWSRSTSSDAKQLNLTGASKTSITMRLQARDAIKGAHVRPMQVRAVPSPLWVTTVRSSRPNLAETSQSSSEVTWDNHDRVSEWVSGTSFDQTGKIKMQVKFREECE